MIGGDKNGQLKMRRTFAYGKRRPGTSLSLGEARLCSHSNLMSLLVLYPINGLRLLVASVNTRSVYVHFQLPISNKKIASRLCECNLYAPYAKNPIEQLDAAMAVKQVQVEMACEHEQSKVIEQQRTGIIR
jgi:hypothetical protein